MSIQTPPVDEATEKAVLGACLVSLSAFPSVADVLTEEHFSPLHPAHRHVYKAMLACYEDGQPTDIRMVASRLSVMGQLDEVGGSAFLRSLPDFVASVKHLPNYVDVLGRVYARRRTIDAAHRIISMAGSHDGTADLLYSQADALLFASASLSDGQDFRSIGELYNEVLDEVEARQGGGDITGLPSGFHFFDEALGGMQKSDLIVLAARPSMGKTTFATNIGCHVAEAGGIVALFSMEMKDTQVAMRVIAAASGVDMHKLRTGKLGTGMYAQHDELADVLRSEALFRTMPLFINDAANLTVAGIRAKARKLQSRMGKIDLIIIDYAQLITTNSKSENRSVAVGEVTRQLKALARELDVPIILLSQLSREVEKRQSKIPQLSDLRDSGSIEQDADIVLFIYRDEYYDPDSTRIGIGDIIIAKHRNGELRTVSLRFNKTTTSFEDLTLQEVEELAAI